MTVTIEAFGPVRTLIGGPSARLEVPGPLTVRSALAAAAARHPRLVGAVLRDERGTPMEMILVNLDGQRFLHDLDEALPDDSHLVLLTALAGGAAAPDTVSGHGMVVEVDDPLGLVTRWQQYGRDRLFLHGLKGVYIGLDDGHVPEFTNPAYPWGCEPLPAGNGPGGYRYWFRETTIGHASVVVRFTGARER